MNKKFFSNSSASVFNVSIFVCALILFACDSQPTSNEPGQALVRVDGEEITVIQLNDELGHAKVQASQVEQAKKQLLESMIDRQLMIAEAKRSQLDRAPNVMRAIERAKMQIIAQSYMQTILSHVNKPSETEISQFYREHPELFSQRKKYHLTFLRFSANNLNDTLNAAINSAKSLDDVAKLLDKHEISYLRDAIIRTTMGMSPQMIAKLQATKKGEMLLVNENTSNLMILVENIENDPVSIEDVKLQISMHLLNQKRREAAKTAIAQLRAEANIEYLHATAESKDKDETGSASQSLARPLADDGNKQLVDDTLLQNESIERGIGGLR
ncbi:peptidyl-prolyl cis-trans isomerase, EpsD family [Nitrosomonas sp. Nm51]|uniref:EpsD family peptidyl-prolyl cis-trans isomerase n=1 Tax=Nitrosomonas sp. Nm51 TaxID=133720 RepID=UPI0008CDE323|nr:EpsD family peptidyl-prolyl cis-trans isomerase [Nitrosomonas sp. Nm51]SER64848.1 peptidyl-prolyl cis-trans isomerase, EpsD family [Nitrosomonas sp. Nm51]